MRIKIVEYDIKSQNSAFTVTNTFKQIILKDDAYMMLILLLLDSVKLSAVT